MIALLLAQFLFAPDSRSMQAVRDVFAAPPPEKATLNCQIEKFSPRLGFSLFHWSGFNVSLPVKQFSIRGPGVRVAIALEITPKGESPVYLGESFEIPAPPPGMSHPKGSAATYSGGYYIGPGEYQVRLYVADEDKQECRKEWKIKVRHGNLPHRLEPNQVVPVGGERWRGLDKDNPPNRLTIVLEVAPLRPRRIQTRLSSYDRSILLTSLTTLLDQTKATDATVIAVDPRNRKIIYRTDDFTPRELGRLARAVAGVNLGVVSLETLQGPNASEFMESVLAAAQVPAAKSESVIFLGPMWSWQGRVTPKMRELAQSLPSAHFLGLSYPGMPDNLVAEVVKAANGKVKRLITPTDFAKAIEKVK